MAFQSEPDPEERFPHHPVFAHGYNDNVGCWATIEGRMDGQLECLMDTLDPEALGNRYVRTMTGTAASASHEIIRANRAYGRSLLTLRVLVQNRRKEKTPILVFGSRAQVLSKVSSTDAVQRGRTEIPRAALGVAKDPWDKSPRLRVPHFNTFELRQAAPAGGIDSDYKHGTIRLNKGDFAVFQLQFHVGDDDTISKDWQALDALESIALPWAPWDNSTAPAFTALGLPSLQGPPLVHFSNAPGRLLCAPFDHGAVHEYFADLIEDSEDAFLRSHFGSSSAVLSNTVNVSMFTMADTLLKRVAEEGNVNVLLGRLRACGRHDIVEKLVQ
ncbi:hypothetical protein TRAPUB_12739 [Trametes pubescens]|uniref:Uncharacterized protein n=1 Tax=Trametes pubescens TaxID=154538 RepID=A0A1M2VT23_TRAPU|nr:hypothetical protein TRAPUB_12739 [Trametes pubescens]